MAELSSGEETPRRVQVVIVGGGIAGIAAARKLFQTGITDIVILEAQDRCGGRIHTAHFDGGHLNLGAEWIHGKKGNGVFKVAKQHNLVAPESHYDGSIASEFSECAFITSSKKTVPKKIVNEMCNLFEQIENDLDEFGSSSSSSENDSEEELSVKETTGTKSQDKKESGIEKKIEDGMKKYGSEEIPPSVGEFFDKQFQAYMTKCQGDSSDLKEIKAAFSKWWTVMIYLDNACFSVYDFSILGWNMYEKCEGYQYLVVKNGFYTIFEALVKDIPDSSIFLSKPVKTVHWHITDDTSGPGVKVDCEDGARFEADHVIVTPSLGYLKAKHNTLFSPPLPEELQIAIDHHGFGIVNKVFLEWDEPFWDEDMHGYHFLWLDSFPVYVESAKTMLKTSTGKNWYDGLVGFEVVEQRSDMLLTWVFGEQGKLMEVIPEEEIIDVCWDLLKTFLRRSDIPRPKALIRSQWYSNEYIRGSYSYLTMNSTFEDHAAFGKPLPSFQHPKLLFAGEASSLHQFSSAHGALKSGEDAALTILNYSKRKDKSL